MHQIARTILPDEYVIRAPTLPRAGTPVTIIVPTARRQIRRRQLGLVLRLSPRQLLVEALALTSRTDLRAAAATYEYSYNWALKPVRFVSTARDDLATFPEPTRRAAGYEHDDNAEAP